MKKITIIIIVLILIAGTFVLINPTTSKTKCKIINENINSNPNATIEEMLKERNITSFETGKLFTECVN